ncbi:MAG TPA: hypothetical protein VFJ25_04215, partial [Casimicrobiaceae bacterium]|nr:hypothetical protein [Casimicrobiaceae bacterium]
MNGEMGQTLAFRYLPLRCICDPRRQNLAIGVDLVQIIPPQPFVAQTADAMAQQPIRVRGRLRGMDALAR